jgi:hypothetical protein
MRTWPCFLQQWQQHIEHQYCRAIGVRWKQLNWILLIEFEFEFEFELEFELRFQFKYFWVQFW